VSSNIHRSTIKDTEFDRNRRRRFVFELLHVFLLCLSATASRTRVAWRAFLKLFCSWQGWVSDQSEQTLTSYSAHNKSFWRQAFRGNHLTTDNVNDRRFASHKNYFTPMPDALKSSQKTDAKTKYIENTIAFQRKAYNPPMCIGSYARMTLNVTSWPWYLTLT